MGRPHKRPQCSLPPLPGAKEKPCEDTVTRQRLQARERAAPKTESAGTLVSAVQAPESFEPPVRGIANGPRWP